MVHAPPYWQMAMLTNAGQYQLRERPQAKSWLQAQWPDALDNPALIDRDFQITLWDYWQSEQGQALIARLSLRCWVTHQIVLACRQLAVKFGQTYGFTSADLWILVLDDEGQLEPQYQPRTLKILNKYDPTQSALKTWAIRVIKGDSEINRFLLDQGLYRASDWSILNDTKVKQLPRILSDLSQGEIQQASQLLAAYHQVYRQDRINQLEQKQLSAQGRRCLDPNDGQLKAIQPHTPTNVTLSQLHDLADKLRQHRLAVGRGAPFTQSLDSPNGQDSLGAVDPPSDENEGKTVQDAFLEQYQTHFLESLGEAIQHVVQVYADKFRRRKPPKNAIYLQALLLFHCHGKSMGEIAQELGLKSQVQVTRLLQLKRFRADVCAYWLNQLKPQIQNDALKHMTPKRLDQITQELDDFLTQATEAVIDEATSEAQIPRNRTTHSVFAKRLCQTLSSLSDR